MIGTSKNIWGFDPRSVPGCAMWFDAADSNTITLSSGSLTQWNDKSGNGRNLTAVSGYANATVSSAFQNGLNVFNLSGNGLYRTVANSAVYPQDVYIIVALKSLTAQSDVLAMGPTDADNFNSLIFSEGTQSRWKNGSSNGVRNVFSPTDETSTGFLLIQWSIANDNYLLRRNGTLLAQSSSFTYSLPGGSIFQVGFRHTNITAANFSGYIGEIVVFNNQLGDTQRQQVEGYLAHKWGLVPYYDSTTPLSIPGCQLWLDGADPSGTGTPPANGTILSTWVDKSGNGRNTTATGTGPTYTTNIFNGYSAPVFNGTTMTTPSYLITTDSKLSIFMLCKKTGSRQTGENSGLIGIAAGYQYFYLYIRTSVTNYLETYYQLTVAELTNYSISDGTTLLMTILTNGLSISGYLGGTSVFNTSVSNNGYSMNNLTSRWNIGEGQFVGPICEIIIFNSTFTNAQRQTIEGYLAKKWGIGASTIPSIHPFSSIRPHLRTFQPIDVPGCQLWLDAADQSSLTLSGSSVTQWRDKSGRGFNVATSSGATAPLYNSSTKELQFVSGNSNSFTIPQAFGDALVGTTFSFFFIGRRTVNTTYVYFLSGATSGGNQNLFIGFLSNKMEIGEYGPYASADIPTFNSPDPMRLYYYDIQSSTTANLIMNGNPLSTTVSGNLFLTSFAQPELGRRYGGAVYHDFNLSEMVVFSPALNTSQRQQVEGYLAHKWGLSPTYATNTPLSIPGCQLWLDAADSSTITGTTSITAWRDKSGRGNNAVFTGTNPSYVAASNVVITANLNQGFTVPAATIQQTTGSGSIFLVYGDQQTQGSSYAALFSSPLPAQSFCQSLKRPDSYSYQFNNSTSPVLATVVNALNTTNTIIYTMNYTYNSTTGSIRVNGTTCASSFNSSPTPSGALTISSSGWGDGANVRLYEIITFVNVVPLTTVQQQQIEGYLAKKWGLTVSGQFLSTHPFRSIPPAILPFSPRNITGLSLWLDAADQGSLTLSGSSVTQWRDKSGNGYNATISSGRIGATYSSVSNCVYFQASNVGYQTSYPANPTNETMFVVANIDSPSGINNNTLICGQQGARSLGIGWNGYDANACAYLNSQIAWQTSTPSGSYTAGTTALITGQVSGGSTLSIAMNGATFTTGSGGGFYANTTTYLGVDTTNTAYYYKGFVMEILFYNSVLNTTQRQQVEGYLAHKWGLTGSLPSTHPYSKLPPA